MEGNGKAMRFVPYSLYQEERLRVDRQADRFGATGHEQLLLLLGQTGDRLIRDTKLLQDRQGGMQLTFAAIDQHQVRPPRPVCAVGTGLVRGAARLCAVGACTPTRSSYRIGCRVQRQDEAVRLVDL